MLDHNESVNGDILRLSHPPSSVAYSYASMWAYGNHYHVKEEGVACHITPDSGIACVFIQGSWSSARDRNIVIA